MRTFSSCGPWYGGREAAVMLEQRFRAQTTRDRFMQEPTCLRSVVDNNNARCCSDRGLRSPSMCKLHTAKVLIGCIGLHLSRIFKKHAHANEVSECCEKSIRSARRLDSTVVKTDLQVHRVVHRCTSLAYPLGPLGSSCGRLENVFGCWFLSFFDPG